MGCCRQRPLKGDNNGSCKASKKLGAIHILLAALLSSPATTQQNRNCAPREAVVKRLADKYGESRRSIGLGEQGMVIETYRGYPQRRGWRQWVLDHHVDNT